MRVLMLLCLALLRCEALKLCDTDGLCTCDRTWGKFNCSCTSTETKELTLSPANVPDSTVYLLIWNCSKVHVSPHTWVNHREVQQVEFFNIEELIIESNAFSWNETLALQPGRQHGLVVNIVNSSIVEIPSYAFKGRLTGITFNNVTIGRIRAFAFASLYNTEKLELIECFVKTFEAQAFKKFSLEKLHIIGGYFSGSMPSRTWVDLEVYDLLIERVTINTIRSSAFIVHSPRIFRLYGNYFDNVEGEAFNVKMHGKTLIKNNIFRTLAKGAFIRISVEDFIVKIKGRPALQFENNTIEHFEYGCLLFNMTSFEAQLDHVLLNHTCSCTLLETWNTDLNYHDKQQESYISDMFWCKQDVLEKNGKSYINFKDFSPQCALTSGLHMFLIIILTSSLLLLAVVLLVIFLWHRHRSRYQRRWINVPTMPNNDSKKKKFNTEGSNVQNKGENGQDSRPMMVVPDGRTYREMELHVIVERTEPIVEHEYVDTTIDERSMKNRQ